MATSFKRSHTCTVSLSALNPAADHHQPTPPPETPRHPQAILGQSLVGLLLLSPGSWCTRFCCALQESVLPVLCKFWWLYGGVNGDLLQEDLCHSQLCCTQSPCPCGRPLLTHTSAGNTQTLKSKSVSVSVGSLGPGLGWGAQGLFEASEPFWRVWGLILNVISPLVMSCWGFSFALGHGVSFFGGIHGSDGKASACNAGDLGLIPGLGRSPGEGNGNPLQHSCLENPMDRGA